jgi:hypothetical protein
MTATQEIVEKVLNLRDDQFFTADRSVLSPRESQLLEMDFSGVAVNAPGQVFTNQHDTLPLVIASSFSGDRDWDVSLRDNCILVASNLDDGTVRVANALLTEKELTSRGGRSRHPKGPKPSGLAEVASQLTEVDARGRLNIDWTPAMWAIGVLYFDWPSNTVVVRLDDGIPARRGTARSIYPAHNPDVPESPDYLPASETPEPPESGVSFQVRFGTKGARQSLTVNGAFAVPFRDSYVPEQEIVHEFRDGSRREVRAVVPVTLIMLKLDEVSPWQFDWAVPVYDEPSAAEAARGFFNIDALASGDSDLDAGSYACYIIADGKIFGPREFKV